ncbi:CUB-like domain-containing protein [Caenorhabditis elegans]|uniref:CUB-like domain-containing protein n=1 Tax=Caenorhabditis elegans TaxID=6239 RepID=Q52GY0_CAEEL|nr:CUB-like domain-containing protein [Caenorhabditis elegans]CAI91172.1 CUB-like domain-containing protein [Caenorhabditis elegans]|eukprot:NP_001023880.1 DAF-16/FOXO Controlled, germline Tumor affecting [Caenorhabditis elegans]
MSARFVAFLLITSNLIILSKTDDDFTCPTIHITKDTGMTGAIPAGATSMTKIPAGTDCTYIFDIPKGFAIKMETSAVYDVSPGDSIKFDYFYISSPAEKEVEYAVNQTLPYEVISKTGNLTFFATYTYIDMTNYQQVIKPTGTYFNATLETDKYFTVQAADNDQVVLKYGSRQTGFVDTSIYEVFVFDGNDILNSKYLGRLTELYRRPQYDVSSTSNTLTLLDLYGMPSDSLLLGNDASTVENMGQYSVFVIDSDKELDGYMGNYELEPDSWYTFICNDCSSFTIGAMTFDRKFENASGYIEVQGMSPTQKLQPVLKYPYSTNSNSSFPQLIPSPMATFHIHNASVTFVVKPGVPQNDFAAAPGQSRSVYSPQIWNPAAEPKFDYTFSDPVKVYNFSINLQTVKLENDGDELDVQVGSVDGLTTLDKKYNKDTKSDAYLSGIGRYLNLKYTGSKTSEVILNFVMIDRLNPDGTTQSPGTTVVPSGSFSTAPIVTSVSTRATRVSSSTAPVVSTVTSTITSQSIVTTNKSSSPITSKTTTSINTGSTATSVHVETTTKGTSSLFSAGFLIIVISALTL